MTHTSTNEVHTQEFQIHPEARVGWVTLKVKDLDRQIAFYEQVVGLSAVERNEQQALLGGG